MVRHTSEAIVNRQYQVRIGQYIGDGWQIFTTNAGGYIGFLLLSGFINFIFNVIPEVVATIIGIVISWLLQAGNYFVGFKIMHEQRPEFESFFNGFKGNYFLPIILTNLVSGLIINLFDIPAIFFFIVASLPWIQSFLREVNAQAAELDPDIEKLLELLEQLPPVPDKLQLILVLLGLVLLLVGLYFTISYTFAIPLVVEHKFDFWSAMETSRRLISRNWFSFFLFSLTILLINVLGLCLCCVGLLVTAPLSTCMIVAAYRDIIGLNPSNSHYS